MLWSREKKGEGRTDHTKEDRNRHGRRETVVVCVLVRKKKVPTTRSFCGRKKIRKRGGTVVSVLCRKVL